MKTYIYVCPKCSTYSGVMKLVRINKTYTVDEMLILKHRGIPRELLGERLKCPKCKKVYGWHQLRRIQDD